jgi:hypothetical protein
MNIHGVIFYKNRVKFRFFVEDSIIRSSKVTNIHDQEDEVVIKEKRR